MVQYSKILKFTLIIYLISWIGVITSAQQPAYFTIGENELKNADIYTLHQGEDEIIYAGTDIGLFAYKHGEFIKLKKAKEQTGSSLFQLQRDSNGNLFCCNLNGQIFKVVENKLELFYELPQHLTGTIFQFFIDDQNNFIIFCKNLIKLFPNENNRLKIYDTLGKEPRTVYSAQENLFYFACYANKIWKYENGNIEQLPKLSSFRYKEQVMGIINFNDSLIVIHHSFGSNIMRKSILHENLNTDELHYEKYSQINKLDNNLFSIASKSKGISFFQKEKNTIKHEGNYFQNKFISTTTRAKGSQTILLGTFRKGIIIIPNQNIFFNDIIPQDEECQDICVNDQTIYFTTSSSKIYSYRDSLKLEYYANNNLPLDKIFYADSFLLFKKPAPQNLIYSFHHSTGSIKDVWQKPNGDILIAVFNKLNLYSKQDVDTTFWFRNSKHLYTLKNFSYRTNSVTYSPNYNTTYTSYKGRLIALDSNYNKTHILYDEQKINCQDLFYKDEKLYIASQNHGILILENGSVYSKYNTENGLGDNHVKKIEIKDSLLFISHIDGFQIINLNTDKTTSIGRAEGLPNKTVKNFDIDKNQLWILSDNKIISLDIKNLPQTEKNIHLYLDSITVNDKRIDINQKNQFPHQEKKIDFYLDFRTVILQDETKIYYKLEGSDKEWTTTNINNHIVSYKTLPPGNYTFKTYAQYRNQKSNEIIYSFRINYPIWQRWWFFLLISLFILTAFYLFYKNRMNQLQQINQAEREKQIAEKEMIESELKALRSQMNPHFIFNSLNSIQDLILREETDKSYDYIVLFADLVRSTLNHSNKNFIPISKELEFLNIYLSLEKLRFKDDFHYTIHHSQIDGIEIPSLLIQPFIENALLHGLLHKKGKKELNIYFEIIGDILHCTVIDNGIGRERAIKIRKRQKRQHESFSMEAIKKRLSFLGGQYDIDAQYEFIDLMEDSIAIGTKVIIKMPHKRLF